MAEVVESSSSSESSDEETAAKKCEVTLSVSDGGKVILIGTAHFSEKSNDDVREILLREQPDAVMVELCKGRQAIMTMSNEELMSRDKPAFSLAGFRQNPTPQYLLQAMFFIMAENVSDQLKMAPGGEMRAAYQTVNDHLPHCKILFGDRPISITLNRAFSSLTSWEKVKLLFNICCDLTKTITPEDVELLKSQDMIEAFLLEISESFPTFSTVLVTERDVYLTASLQRAVKNLKMAGIKEPVVCGVLGAGHLKGIKNHWTKDISEDEVARISNPVYPIKKNPYTEWWPLTKTQTLLATATVGVIAHHIFRRRMKFFR